MCCFLKKQQALLSLLTLLLDSLFTFTKFQGSGALEFGKSKQTIQKELFNNDNSEGRHNVKKRKQTFASDEQPMNVSPQTQQTNTSQVI